MASDDELFNEVLNGFTLPWETGYDMETGGDHVDPKDPGGRTKWGISSAGHPDVDMDQLDRDGASKIYRDEYWKPVSAMVPAHLPRLRQAVFDAYVNGKGHGTRALQDAVGAEPDGDWGPRSRDAMQGAARTHEGGGGDRLLAERFTAARQRDYQNLALKQVQPGLNPRRELAKHPHFKGWDRRVRAFNGWLAGDQ